LCGGSSVQNRSFATLRWNEAGGAASRLVELANGQGTRTLQIRQSRPPLRVAVCVPIRFPLALPSLLLTVPIEAHNSSRDAPPPSVSPQRSVRRTSGFVLTDNTSTETPRTKYCGLIRGLTSHSRDAVIHSSLRKTRIERFQANR
jgi:hypothetical protein